MPKLDFSKVLRTALLTLSLVFVVGLAVAAWQQSQTQYLTLAAGASSGESYILGSALKKVVERHYPRIKIALLETGGTVENLEMLEQGRAQLATAQSDILPGPTARVLAVLYDDAFQLMVHKDAPEQNLVDLKGKRIALARSGGQFQSFLRVADHFGLRETDFTFVGLTDEAADQAFLNGQADAIFRVRAIGNPSIQQLVQTNKVRFLPIEHAAAMKIKYPAFNPALIPEGAYLGNPPIPANNLPTVAVQRTLLARDNANAEAIRAVTEVLTERKQEMMEEISARLPEVRLLLVQTRRPESQTGFGPALHPGALSFYNKDKPSFLVAHADYVGLILTVALMISSWVWEFKRWMQRQQKNTADQLSNRVMALINATQTVNSLSSLEEVWRDLLAILAEAVHDLDVGKISEESFHCVRSVLQIGMDITREQRAILASRATCEEPMFPRRRRGITRQDPA